MWGKVSSRGSALKKKNKLTALDLFCGSGGVTLGLKNAGFQVLGAVDLDPTACETYRKNHKKVKLIERDIRDIKPSEFSGAAKGRLDLIAVCAPCQPFSSQNRMRSRNDERARLILEALPFIEAFEPRLVFLENVPGLEARPVYREFTEKLEENGYNISPPLCLDAAELGVPQRRQRMVMIAAKGVSLDVAIAIAKTAKKTVRNTLEGLPIPAIGQPAENADPLHFARRHSALNITRLEHIPADGGGRSSLPDHLVLECHKKAKPSAFSDTYGRMKWDDVAPTLTTGCTDITRGRFAHPEQHRAITLREAARLQSFPDEYRFSGNMAQVSAQIGNAVPPRMMQAIAASLRKALATATAAEKGE